MEEEIQRYRADLLVEIQAGAVTASDYERTRFIERACEILQTGEEFTDYGLCRAHAWWKRSEVRLDGYSFSEADGKWLMSLSTIIVAINAQLLRRAV